MLDSRLMGTCIPSDCQVGDCLACCILAVCRFSDHKTDAFLVDTEPHRRHARASLRALAEHECNEVRSIRAMHAGPLVSFSELSSPAGRNSLSAGHAPTVGLWRPVSTRNAGFQTWTAAGGHMLLQALILNGTKLRSTAYADQTDGMRINHS